MLGTLIFQLIDCLIAKKFNDLWHFPGKIVPVKHPDIETVQAPLPEVFAVRDDMRRLLVLLPATPADCACNWSVSGLLNHLIMPI